MKNKLRKILLKIKHNYLSFVWFVIKLVFWVFVLVWLTPLLASTFITRFQPSSVTTNDFILFITAAFIIAYTYETQKMKEEIIQQTELETMPIMALYIRHVSGVKDDKERCSISEKYAITREIDGGIRPADYYIALRNMGSGPAFNVAVESKNFKVEKYQTNFFAPKKDEHAIKIVEKPNNKIRKLEGLNDEIFIIKCQSVFGKNYEYKYRIKNIIERTVEFIDM